MFILFKTAKKERNVILYNQVFNSVGLKTGK